MSKKKADKTAKPLYVMQFINSSDLTILGKEYQREQNDARVAKIAASFNEMVANEPKVSFRDGKFYVFDGQHTIAARKLLNNGNDLPILCKVYHGLTDKDEALLFATQNGTAAKPTSGERMRAWIYGGDREAIDFRNATESTGLVLELGESTCDYHLRCVNTALEMYRWVGEDMYEDALGIIVDAWGGTAESLKLEIIIAVVSFIRLYYDIYDRNRLSWCLKSVDPFEIRKGIKTDFKLVGTKKHINQIYQIYNRNSANIIEKRF